MMVWDLFTWLAIAVLIVVSLAVFVWFLVDVSRLDLSRGPSSKPGSSPESHSEGQKNTGSW